MSSHHITSHKLTQAPDNISCISQHFFCTALQFIQVSTVRLTKMYSVSEVIIKQELHFTSVMKTDPYAE